MASLICMAAVRLSVELHCFSSLGPFQWASSELITLHSILRGREWKLQGLQLLQCHLCCILLVKASCKFSPDLRNVDIGASLVVQWLRICLPVQGTRVQALVQEDPTCCGTTKPLCHNYWACALEPVSHNYWARLPRLKPAHLEPVLHNRRSHCNEKPTHCNEE